MTHTILVFACKTLLACKSSFHVHFVQIVPFFPFLKLISNIWRHLFLSRSLPLCHWNVCFQGQFEWWFFWPENNQLFRRVLIYLKCLSTGFHAKPLEDQYTIIPTMSCSCTIRFIPLMNCGVWIWVLDSLYCTYLY